MTALPKVDNSGRAARIAALKATMRARIIVLDGAMGTELYNRGIFINRCFEDANLSSPSLVRELHREYHKRNIAISMRRVGEESQVREHPAHE